MERASCSTSPSEWCAASAMAPMLRTIDSATAQSLYARPHSSSCKYACARFARAEM